MQAPIRGDPMAKVRGPTGAGMGSGDALRDVAPRLVAALYALCPRVGRAHSAAWLDLFELGQADATQREILTWRGESLARMVGAPVVGEDAQYNAILSVQTAVAIVARVVALRVTEPLALDGSPLFALGAGTDADLRHALAVAGYTLAGRGVVGLLEADPFGWYADRWMLTTDAAASAELAAALRAVLAVVAALPLPHAAGEADLFTPLTQAIVPGPVRHALGEFYTPGWLADVVVDGALAHAGSPAGWRALDPCCGSGAFLLALARRVLEETRALPPAERVRAVLDRVAGVDLHPLPVLTARVNLLVALAPLLQRGDRVTVHVYQGDATNPDDPRLAEVGRRAVVVGNPPWVDWKRMPPAQRARLRDTATIRGLYSGDGYMGGVSVNVCALIASVAADTCLAPGGALGFLMPRSLAVQASYAGFRALRRADGGRRRVVALDDWAGVGHPFAPVTERFLTWYIADGAPSDVVPTSAFRRRSGREGAPLERRSGVAGTIGAGNAFTWAADRAELERFAGIAGTCAYIGREGVEFYPQEVWLFEVLGPAADGRVRVRNFQGGKSRYRVPPRELELEAEWLHPLVKGVDLGRFGVTPSALVVPFPYAPGARYPLPMAELRERSPHLAAWLCEQAPLLQAQTPYNARIVGRPDAEPHALARVGRYSFARVWVAFRDNTSWGASVVTTVDTAWGGTRAPRFQNHAVSLCERADGALIDEDEAHYVCAVLNAPIVACYLGASSDVRSFKIRPPVTVPPYDPADPRHRALGALSRRGHAGEPVDTSLDAAYLAALAR
jgi:hypothetical protein